MSVGILKTTMLTCFPLMVMVELYMFYMSVMAVQSSMFKVEPLCMLSWFDFWAGNIQV